MQRGRGAACAIVRLAACRFRTIQVCAKDLPALLRQFERAAERPAAPTRKEPDVRHEAARFYYAPRRRGGGMAAPGARAAERTRAQDRNIDAAPADKRGSAGARARLPRGA